MGHAFAALTASEIAREAGGRFLLRIEDIDLTRARKEFETAIYEDLSWLGLAWAKPVLRQSERLPAYRAALEILQAQQLLYPCFCTRSEVAMEIARAGEAPYGPQGSLYPGTCLRLTETERRNRVASGAPYALRLDSHKVLARTGALSFLERGRGPNGETGQISVDPLLFGDIVIARKETPTSYHLSVVIDDAYQNVTLVTRGNDLFAATHVQRVLQALLDLPSPTYAHHRLILGDRGEKLSKRDKATSLRPLREAGTTPEMVRAMIFPRQPH